MSEPDYKDIVYRLRNPTYWFFQIVGPLSGASVHGESNAPRDAADEIARLRAELAARDELLRYVRKWKVSGDAELAARIDAALKGDGDE